MQNQNWKKNGGFIRFIMLVIIVVLLLGYFNIGVRNFIDTRVVSPIKGLFDGTSTTTPSTTQNATTT